jgi:CSLREA domain-containing protein
VIPLLGLAACGEDQPTAPETAGPAPSIAAAAVRVVNSAADPGDGTCNPAQCTLREALKDPATTAIQFAPGLTGPITLAPPAAGGRGGELRIDRSVTITGPSGGLVIRRRVTDPAFRILRVASGVTATLSNLTFRGGKTDLPGGGIINYGRLTLANCRVTDNESSSDVFSPGGGIYNKGPLTLTNSVVARNTGGGIASHSSQTVSITNSTVTRNQGRPAVFDNWGELVIRHSAITDNAGGGIYRVGGRKAFVLDDVRVVGNSYGVALFNVYATVNNSTIARNSRGGMAISKGRLIITNSTISGNSKASGSGGGIYAKAQIRGGVGVYLTNSTVSGNSAAIGGGVYAESEQGPLSKALVHVVNSTVAFNTATQVGGGIAHVGYPDEPSYSDLVNTIVAQNTAPEAPDISIDQNSGVRAAANSLIGDGTGNGITNEGGNLVGNMPPYTAPIDPLLGTLSQNGGPTATHALLAGSPAIDAGTSEGPPIAGGPPEACPPTDQRGVARPQGEAYDIGAFERE